MAQTQRTEPPLAGSEAEVLTAFLDYHRDTVRRKLEGLDSGQLDQRLQPSTMTLGGLLKHLAHVEDWWLNQVFAGNPEPEPWASADWRADNDWEWHSAALGSPEELRGLFDDTVTVSDRILVEALAAANGLEALSEVDLLREAVDGQTGE